MTKRSHALNHFAEGGVPSSSDFARFITRQHSEHGKAVFHVTAIYKAAATPQKASATLRRFVPSFMNKAVSSHWSQSDRFDDIQMLAFLEPPCARTTSNSRIVGLDS